MNGLYLRFTASERKELEMIAAKAGRSLGRTCMLLLLEARTRGLAPVLVESRAADVERVCQPVVVSIGAYDSAAFGVMAARYRPKAPASWGTRVAPYCRGLILAAARRQGRRRGEV